jgi:hypothetical protein
MSKYLKVIDHINTLANAKGYHLTGVGDGEEYLGAKGQTLTALYEWATQCDCGSLNYKNELGDSMTFYLIYGNAIYETIADGGYNTKQAETDWDWIADNLYNHFEALSREYN